MAESWVASVVFDLFSLTFPHLTSFHVRNNPDARFRRIPKFFLFNKCHYERNNHGMDEYLDWLWWSGKLPDDLCFSFMERHPQLQSLTWPADMLFDDVEDDVNTERATRAVATLGQNLTSYHSDRADRCLPVRFGPGSKFEILSASF